MKKAVTVLAVFAVILVIPFVAAAENKIVEAQGESISSKEDAIRQAMRLAVEQAVGVFVHSETEVENFELKKDKILSRTQGYVTRYTVLKEEKTDDLITVVIQATVSLDKIKDDLLAMKILLDSMERPKVMILIEETLFDAGKTAGPAGDALNPCPGAFVGRSPVVSRVTAAQELGVRPTKVRLFCYLLSGESNEGGTNLDEITGQQQGVRTGYTGGHAPFVGTARPLRAHGHQVRLRQGVVRGLYRVPRRSARARLFPTLRGGRW